MKPRPMQPDEDAKVRALYTLCHPTWPEREPGWFFAYPTLVVEDDDGLLIGSTSFSISLAPIQEFSFAGDRVMYGHDVCVHPDARGRGLGRQLCQARFAVAHDVKAGFFLGMTWKRNTPMLRIFAYQGLQPFRTITDAYPQNPDEDADGVLWVGPVRV